MTFEEIQRMHFPERYFLDNGSLVKHLPKADGFKAFHADMRCRICDRFLSVYREMAYETGKFYEVGGPLELCKNGLHFCFTVHDVYRWYHLSFDIRVCRVTAYGDLDVADDQHKACTSLLHVDCELSPEEIVSTLEEFKFRIDRVVPPEHEAVLESLWMSVEGWRKYKAWVSKPYGFRVDEKWLEERYKAFCRVDEKWLEERYKAFRAALKEKVSKEDVSDLTESN